MWLALFISRSRFGFPWLSVKALRVDIDLDPEIAADAFGGAQPEADVAREVEVARTLRQKAHPVAAADHGDGGIRRPEQPEALGLRRCAQQPAGKAGGGVVFAGRNDQRRQPAER